MDVPMKVLSREDLLRLNESSARAGRRQNLKPEQLPELSRTEFIINFHFDHEWDGQKDVRLSVILQPGVRTAWLDVSVEEYEAIRVRQVPELEWETAICVGVPPWTK